MSSGNHERAPAQTPMQKRKPPVAARHEESEAFALLDQATEGAAARRRAKQFVADLARLHGHLFGGSINIYPTWTGDDPESRNHQRIVGECFMAAGLGVGHIVMRRVGDSPIWFYVWDDEEWRRLQAAIDSEPR